MDKITPIIPRKVAAIDRSGGFKARPILPHGLLPHDLRRDFNRNIVRRCGYCGEMVKVGPEWQNHKEYCWGQQWNQGFTRGEDSHIKIEDRQWAEGDRNMRR